jgi:diadenosine tetraphosphate (Ap4A) HIT family hydrolase
MDSNAPPPCAFCKIAATYPPTAFNDPTLNPTATSDEITSHLILSTEHIMAFLDIMPLTRGHVLVAPRQHYQTLGDMGVLVGQEVCN